MSLPTVLLSALFFTLLGTAYVKGYDMVKKRSAQHLPYYYLTMAAIRFVLVATTVAIYAVLSEDHRETVHFAALFLVMYAVMMVITLTLKH